MVCLSGNVAIVAKAFCFFVFSIFHLYFFLFNIYKNPHIYIYIYIYQKGRKLQTKGESAVLGSLRAEA